VGKLKQIEAIKQLKYRYMRCLDSKLWDEMREVFSDDAVSHYDQGRHAFECPDAIIGFLRDTLGRPGVVSLHQVHHPEIEILNDREAKGTWYLHDFVLEFRRQQQITGTAFYRDTYVKRDGRWKIRSTEFERIYEISEPIGKRPNVTYSYLETHGRRLPPGELAPFRRDEP